MEAAANMVFRSINAIYESAISSSTLYPTSYFLDNEKKCTFYGFRIREVIPTRLIVRIYEEAKNFVVDMLWLVDDIKIEGNGQLLFSEKSSKITVEGSPKFYINKAKDDVTIQACYEDLLVPSDFFQMMIVGSKEWFPPKLQSETKINIGKIPTHLYSFSRCILNQKKIKDEEYQDIVINGFLALIDLVHRSLEILNSLNQKHKGPDVFCIRCGQKLPSDSYYCPICGTKQN